MKMYVADPLVAKLEAERHKLAMRGHLAAEHHVVEHALKIVQAEPTVDAEPVVRCKDCKHHRNRSCPMRSLGLMPGGRLQVVDNADDNGFCYMGAKMDGGVEGCTN